MTDRETLRRIADAHADFYGNHVGRSMADFAREYWSPDIKFYPNGIGTPFNLEQFMRGHDAEGGFSWDETHIEVKKVVVGDDAFVIQMAITQWRSHEADAQVAGGDGTNAMAYQQTAVPSLTVYHVADGKVVRNDMYVILSAVLDPAAAAAAAAVPS
jgi:hypothetical protein